MTDMKKFFTALSERAYKENDLSDVTYAMCESDICFKKFFLDFFFAKDNLDASSTSIEREHSTDWGRPDFWIRTKDGSLYIVEVKIWDGNHHFEQYYDILKGKNVKDDSLVNKEGRNEIWEHLGYIANYEAVKNIEVNIGKGKQSVNTLCKVATWKDFVEKLEGENKFKAPMIVAYIQYVKCVCPFDDFDLNKWIGDNSSNMADAFKNVKTVSNGISNAISTLAGSEEGSNIDLKSYTRSSRKFIPQYRMGSFFEFNLTEKQRVWGWFGVYYRNDGGIICIEFEDKAGWGKPVCEKFRDKVKDGCLRFYFAENISISEFLKNIVDYVIKESVSTIVTEEAMAQKFPNLLFMKALPMMLEQELLGKDVQIEINGKKYELKLAYGNDAEVPESHCGRYFELTKSISGQQDLSEQKTSVRGWIGMMYSSSHKDKDQKPYDKAPQFMIEIEKNFANAQLNGRENSGWYDDSWGWKCFDLYSGPSKCDLANMVKKAFAKFGADM